MTKGFWALAKSKTAITDLIGSDPMRLYPRVLPQGLTEFPAAAYRFNSNRDTADFDGPSTYDFGSIDIWWYGRDYKDSVIAYETGRKQLEGSSGIYAGIDIDYVWYVDSGMEDYIDDLQLHTKLLEIRVAYRRQPVN